MGDTKEKSLQRGIYLARIITAALCGIVFVVAFAQVLFFQNIKVSFQTGVDAQQLSTMKMKKGSKVDLPTPLKPGSYFLGWSLSPNSAEVLEDSTSLVKDTTLYAVWDGAEKYAILSVNGVTYKEVNIFDTSVEGLTDAELNYGKFGGDSWRVLDDYAQDNPNLALGKERYGQAVDPYNNFTRFLGWRYLNSNNTYNDLLYTQDASGVSGTWVWVQRDENSNVVSETQISETNKFYPPNYRTTFTALLDYRIVNIQLYDSGAHNSYDNTYSFQLGTEGVTLPVYTNNATAHFSHWEIQEDHLKSYINADEQPELAAMVNNVKKRYAAGETLTIDPLWYYYGKTLMPLGTKDAGLVVVLKFNAVYWDDESVYHYSVQPFTDLDSGTTYQNFGNVRDNDLSVENPVAYDEVGNCFWLYYDPQILSYAFYDHKGVYHVFTTDQLRETRAITIGDTMTLLDEEIYFKDEWGINVMVNYQTSAKNITVKFEYGDDLYLLPNYRHYENVVTDTLTARIGSSFEIWTGEKYMKTNYIFTGWQIVGDESGRIYYAGEKFTIPNFDTENESTVIEFVAVWHLQRLLFDFDFDGGSWATEEGPDFTLMKGAYGDRVRIVSDVPVKFGYDFVGWTLEDGTEYLQPNDYIWVGTKFQTLHAHWVPMRLNVTFYVRYDADGNWAARANFRTDVNDETLYSGGTVQLPDIPVNANRYYISNGWQIGNYVIDNTQSQYVLTTNVLSQLETVVREDAEGLILNVHIYASQTKRTLNVNYDFMVNTIDMSYNVSTADLATVLPQGDFFYDYYPFSVARTNGSYDVFDTNGRQFISWSYTTDGSTYISIDADTRVPAGVSQITVIGSLSESKSISVEYYDNNANFLTSDNNGTIGQYNFGSMIELKNYGDLNIPNEIDGWGTFVGWSFEPDYKAGNPKTIYDVYYYTGEHGGVNPYLQLSNQNNTTSTPYTINVDGYAEQVTGLNYTLRLYAVYANDYATIEYSQKNEATALKLPVFSNGDYAHSTIGGRTVGYDSADFAAQGVAVLDDSDLMWSSAWNFIGWEAVLPDGVSDEIKAQLANKIWFPGEYLPSVDFGFTFNPLHVVKSNQVQEVTVGNRTYRVLALLSGTSKVNYTGSVDIVALPRGDYTVKQGNIIINSDREVHVLVPSEGNITLEPRAIQCNTIKEFYVGENLTITGSPVVGDNFQAYRVQKGYRILNDDGSISAIVNASAKYSFAASMSGLLVSADETVLYGVPSHTTMTTASLLNFINQSVTEIVGYALSDLNNMTTINLAKNSNLQIDALAIFGGNVSNVILPAGDATTNVVVDPQVLAGALTNLTSVTFGDATTTATWYAFVDSGFVYYVDNLVITDAKTHLMYATRLVKLNNLTYTNNNLTIADTVTTIEPYALAGLDWSKINTVTANNVNIDLTVLKEIPTDIPLFTDAANTHKGPMIQPYIKTFRFTYKDGATVYETVTLEFAYGQTFRVFSAQKNNYNVAFERAWSQFVAWKFGNKMLNVGEVYKVGVSEAIIGDKYTLQFDASSTNSWRAYPVQFITYNNAYSANDFELQDVDGNQYEFADLLDSNSLDSIYLPGLDHTVTVGGVQYQFIGWATTTRLTNTTIPNLWNSVSMELRVLPNRTTNAVLSSGGVNTEGIYVYYALYEPVTPNMQYTVLDDGTYAVSAPVQFNATSLNIPFAHYNEGYMVPISTVNNFSGISTGSTLTEIAIGGAVSEIGKEAFQGVQAAQINFAHKGRSIYYNYRQTSASKQLTIGENAFANNAAIEDLVLPAALETLGNGVFRSCSNLYSVAFESGYSPYIRNLGDFVFRDDTNLKNNALVKLLSEDGNDGNYRFVTVGNGIFMHTDVDSVDDTHKIVWRDTLLHVYYASGDTREPSFNEKIIAGYAFVDLGSADDDSLRIIIKFTNKNVQVKANAFSYLNKSVTVIRLDTTGITPTNVDIQAFDSLTDHAVSVYTNSLSDWDKKFNGTLSNNITLFGRYGY